MYPQTHFLFSWLIGLILAKVGLFSYKTAFFIALVAVLIDVDHYIKFILYKKDFDFKHAWNQSGGGIFSGRSFIHHWMGFVIVTAVVVVLYFLSVTWFWIIGLGYYSHLFLDYAHLNVLKIKGRVTVKEFGIVEKVSKFELLLDGLLLVGVVLLLI